MKHIKIAIDGPASSGKSTTAKLLAKRLGYNYIDTGAMYRAVTYLWLNNQTDVNDEQLGNLIDNNKFEFNFHPDNPVVYLNDKNITKEIRSKDVTDNVSEISANGRVREKMVELQRKMSEERGTILDGRDIGTVVFPDAELKIFLIASIESRAYRRFKEMEESGMEADLNDIKDKLIARDKYDSSRANSPLRKADDAVEIDTSDMTIEEQVKKVYDLAVEVINKG
jgi:cytidylate kinase